MRLSSVTIFFAIAACSVGVDVHAELSGIVAKDGRFEEVQGHVRAQEPAHDKDNDDERVDLEGIATSNAVEHVKEVLEPTILESNPLKRPAEMLESEKRPAKIATRVAKRSVAKASKAQSRNNVLAYPQDADSFINEAIYVYELNENTGIGEQLPYPFSFVLALFDKDSLPKIVDDANKRLLAMHMGYEHASILYGLQFAKDDLFEQPQLVYWVMFFDAFNIAHPDKKITLLEALGQFYSTVDLAKAVMKNPMNEYAKHVHNEMYDAWIPAKSPFDVFADLGLEKDGDKVFVNELFLFWTQYVRYYNSKKTPVSIQSVLVKYHFSEKEIEAVLRSDITVHLDEEIMDDALDRFHESIQTPTAPTSTTISSDDNTLAGR